MNLTPSSSPPFGVGLDEHQKMVADSVGKAARKWFAKDPASSPNKDYVTPEALLVIKTKRMLGGWARKLFGIAKGGASPDYDLPSAVAGCVEGQEAVLGGGVGGAEVLAGAITIAFDVGEGVKEAAKAAATLLRRCARTLSEW